jgi:hypothetical protein
MRSYATTFPRIPHETEAFYSIVGRALLLPFDISPCPVLPATMSQLLPITISLKFVVAKILLQRSKQMTSQGTKSKLCVRCSEVSE